MTNEPNALLPVTEREQALASLLASAMFQLRCANWLENCPVLVAESKEALDAVERSTRHPVQQAPACDGQPAASEPSAEVDALLHDIKMRFSAKAEGFTSLEVSNLFHDLDTALHAAELRGAKDGLEAAARKCDEQAERRPENCKWEQGTCKVLGERIRALSSEQVTKESTKCGAY